jgi:hypothetical protein
MSERPDSSPRLTVVGGPNGVGKSTFLVTLRETGYPLGRFLNPDDIAQTLRVAQPARELQAVRETLRQSRALIATRTTFSCESTLSSNKILRTIQTAKDAGFAVVLLFIGVSSVETTKRRVQTRVEERFAKTFTAAGQAVRIANTALFAEHRRAREACDPYALARREAQGESPLPPSLEDFGITLPPGVKFYLGPGAVELNQV